MGGRLIWGFGLVIVALCSRFAAAETPSPESAPAPAPAAPAAPDLEGLLFGDEAPGFVTRVPAPRADSPSAITVLDREDLTLHGFTTLGEALGFLPGFFLEASERRLHLVSRGLPDAALFVFDGVPLLSDAARLEVPLEDELDLRKIARIEIVRGPGAASWGRNAFGSVVALVPLTGAEIGGARAELSVGDFATRHFSLLAGERFGDFDVAAAVSWRTSFEPTVTYRATPTLFVFVPNPQGVRIPGGLRDLAGHNRADTAFESWARVAWRGLSLSARYEEHADWGQLASFSHAVLPRDAAELRGGRSFIARALLEQSLGESADLTALLFGTWNAIAEIERIFPVSAPVTPFGGAVATSGAALGAGVHVVLDLRPLRWLGVTAGLQADLARSAIDASFTDPMTGEVTESGVTRDADSAAASAWVLARVTPPRLDALSFYAGGALDLHTDFGAAFDPRAGVVFSPGGGVTLRALYAEADRTPDQFDLVGLAASTFVDAGIGGAAANPDLRPERLRTGEVTATWRLPGKLRVDAAAFVTHVRGLIVREVDPMTDALRARNGEGTRLLGGGELSVAAEALDGRLHGALAYGLVVGEDLDPDLPAPTAARDAPVHEGTATLGWRPIPELLLALDALAIGPRALRDGSGDVLPAELTFDAHLVLRLPDAHLRVELRARNLGGVETFSRNEGVGNRAPTVNLPGAPTSVLLTVAGEL